MCVSDTESADQMKLLSPHPPPPSKKIKTTIIAKSIFQEIEKMKKCYLVIINFAMKYLFY